MAQPPSPDARLAVPTARLDRIEKGWTVYDAVEHPIGTITDVDRDRGRLLIDGRSAGFEDFDVPLEAVREAGDNEVHLTLTVDTNRRADGGTPQFARRDDLDEAIRDCGASWPGSDVGR